jgi:hypothetical protein
MLTPNSSYKQMLYGGREQLRNAFHDNTLLEAEKKYGVTQMGAQESDN